MNNYWTRLSRQLFAGHVVGSRPMERKKTTHRMIIFIIIIFHFYSAHIHYVPEAPYKIIPKTTISIGNQTVSSSIWN